MVDKNTNLWLQKTLYFCLKEKRTYQQKVLSKFLFNAFLSLFQDICFDYNLKHQFSGFLILWLFEIEIEIHLL